MAFEFSRFANLQQRSRQPEMMDQPELDEASHRQALAGLRTINTLSATGCILFGELARFLHAHPGRPLRVLDVACGGGDTAIRLAQMAARREMAIEVDGCDINGFAVRYAQESARANNVQAGFFRCDALNGLPEGYDVLIHSLFLHHLETEQAVAFLQAMSLRARLGIVVTDLIRNRTGFALARTVPRVISRSRVVHIDAIRSVHAAFTINEARQLAASAGLDNATVRMIWPMRFLLAWRRQ